MSKDVQRPEHPGDLEVTNTASFPRRLRRRENPGMQLLAFAEALHAQGLLRRGVLLKLRVLAKKAARASGPRR